MAARMQQRRGTASQWTSANPVLGSGEIGFETDTNKFKIGNGQATWGNLPYFANVNDIIDGAPDLLNTLNELAAALGDDPNAITTIQSDISDLQSDKADVTYVDQAISNVVGTDPGVLDTIVEIADAINNDVDFFNSITQTAQSFADQAEANAITAAEAHTDSQVLAVADDLAETVTNLNNLSGDLDTLSDVIDGHTSELSGIQSAIADQTTGLETANAAILLKAPIDNPTFTGTVDLPGTTSIGDVTSSEIGHLEGVTSPIQSQIDAKLDSGTASGTYAPLNNPTFGGNVSLPSTTAIGNVSATEIEYLNGATSSIQTQITDLDTSKAPKESPTFTGTVSGVTASMVGLGNVDNTSDEDKPVSTAQQTALNAKANLSGAVFTGDVEAIDLVVTGNLTVQGTTTTLNASDLKLKDNMIYLNQAGLATIINAAGNGTNVVYTTEEAHGYSAGDDVTVINVTPSSFNIASPGYSVVSVTGDTFTVASTVTDTYESGGTARGKVHSNPDLGFAAGRYDTVNGNGYAHAGLFRDASDGVFKFFDGYEPEPDESVFIDTSDSSFALADVAVADITAENITAGSIVFSDGTEQTSAGVASLTTFTEKTTNYVIDDLGLQDNIVEMNSSQPLEFRVPTNAALAWPIGASMDIIATGTGEVTIMGADGVTINSTPGLKLRTQWSSATILKRGTDTWIAYGDLKA